VPPGSAEPPGPEWAEGKLAQRATLTLRESLPWLHSARMTGVRQFIETYRALSDAQADELFWGDEIEYAVVRFDEAPKAVRISLRAEELLAELVEKESNFGRRDGFGEGAAWHPEYGAWMIEGTPRLPYGGFTADLRRVEASMVLRRKRLASVLGPNEAVVTMPAFPMMGVGDFCHPMPNPAVNECTTSPTMPDAVMLPAPRFHALTRNIRERRGGKVDIRVPLLRDINTDETEIAEGIRMDAMAYGMGCCCLQVTGGRAFSFFFARFPPPPEATAASAGVGSLHFYQTLALPPLCPSPPGAEPAELPPSLPLP
jgi:glutamate--cysteine ligase catalytic subunit